MKSDQLYRELKNLAEKLGLQVSEQNFRPTGIHVRSGHCLVKGTDHCIIDKHIKVSQKIEVLAECISAMPHESVYVVPAVREFLDQFKPKDIKKNATEEGTEETKEQPDPEAEISAVSDDESDSGSDGEFGAVSDVKSGEEPAETQPDKDSG